MPLTFAVLADSHFHPPGVPAQAAWASDALFNARNAVAVEMVRRADPAFVVHLGDVPHPVPGLPEHAEALAVARATYAPLACPLYVVPGNHDVGDKPHPWAPAPSVSAAKHDTFRAAWGPPWWVVERDGVRLVGIDTPVLNSGLDLEAEQWEWLATALAPGPRTFVFLHYPPFLLEPAEPEHYDNVAEPARSRLLTLLRHAEAVFCGHVHHPFWNRLGSTDFYLLPSTAFVRPGYAELGRIGPGDEFGRNDVDRLGFCLVRVDDTGHRVEWVRTGGATNVPPLTADRPPDNPLGLTLRHAWDAVLDIPADGLDPFRRKQARNDLVLLATWELGVRTLRLPFQDLRNPVTRARLLALPGQRVVLYTAEPLSPADLALVEAHAAAIVAVELILPRAWLDRPLPQLAVPRWIAPFGRHATETGRYFSHFAPHGFAPDDPDLARSGGEGRLFRVDPEVEPEAAIAAAMRAASDQAVAALVLLPRAGEGAAFTDDEAVTRRVVATFHAARTFPAAHVFLDTTVDHDRGYFPRHGLLDRRGGPRPAFHALRALARGGDIR
jgi:3',5'-cyclic AMP phosphodiesterase CpdA